MIRVLIVNLEAKWPDRLSRERIDGFDLERKVNADLASRYPTQKESQMTTESLAQVLVQIQAGELAKKEFKRRYLPRLLGLVRKRLWKRTADEKDVSVVLSVLSSLLENHLQAAMERDAEGVWDLLARIAIRHCSKRNKRQERQDERDHGIVPIGVGAEGAQRESREGYQPEDPEFAPEILVAYKETLERLETALTARQRQVLQYVLQGLTRTELPERVNVSQPTVDRDIKVIRDRLSEELDRSADC